MVAFLKYAKYVLNHTRVVPSSHTRHFVPALLSYIKSEKRGGKILPYSLKQLFLRMSSRSKLELMFDLLHNTNPERNLERFGGQHHLS